MTNPAFTLRPATADDTEFAAQDRVRVVTRTFGNPMLGSNTGLPKVPRTRPRGTFS